MNTIKKQFKKIVESNKKTLLLNWESLEQDWATLSTFLDTKTFAPGEYHEN
jgi:hypothetical protein